MILAYLISRDESPRAAVEQTVGAYEVLLDKSGDL